VPSGGGTVADLGYLRDGKRSFAEVLDYLDSAYAEIESGADELADPADN
jgi:hypothetical protein